MTRTNIFIATAFATLTGCAESPNATEAGETGAVGFAGITRSQPVNGFTDQPGPVDDGDASLPDAPEDGDIDPAAPESGDASLEEGGGDRLGSESDDSETFGAKPADLPIGDWMMQVHEVHYTRGGVTMEAGVPELTVITDVDGAPMLLGMAPIYAVGDSLVAEQVDVTTADVEDGNCVIVTALIAEGRQTRPESFEMDVHFEDGVYGEDCEKLGWGAEKGEAVSFSASFYFVSQPNEGSESIPNEQ